MLRVKGLALTLLVGLIAPCLFGFGAAPEEKAPDFAKVERGMSSEQVRQIVGAPKQITRQIFYHRYREQWIYDAPVSYRLTFDCPRGQKPQLLAIVRVRARGEARP